MDSKKKLNNLIGTSRIRTNKNRQKRKYFFDNGFLNPMKARNGKYITEILYTYMKETLR